MILYLPRLAAALEIGAGRSGYLIGALLMSLGVSFFVLGRAGFWRHNARLLVLTQVVVAAAVGSVIFLKFYALAVVAYVVCGLGVGLTYTSSLYYSLHNEPAGGKMAGIHEACLGAGAGLIPFLGGQAAMFARWAEFGSAGLAAFPFAAGAILLLLPYQVWRLSRARRTGASSSAPRA